MSLIDVKKVIEVHEKDERGRKVPHPSIDGKFVVKGYKTEVESIRTDEIKAAREWQKNSQQERLIDGDMTILYLKGDETKETTAQMLINESHESFSKRIKSIPLGEQV